MRKPPGRAPAWQRALVVLLAAVATAVAAVSLAQAPAAHAFGTVNSFGQHAEHERITRAALACGASAAPSRCFEATSITNLAGGNGSFGGVGAPDSDEITDGAAHCDNADFLNVPGYPQSRATATAELTACREHLRARFMQGIAAAARLLDAKGRIVKAEVDLSSSCTFTGGVSGRAKCDVFDGLGRALHGTEDFYSHSNWADQSDPAKPTSLTNPPGLANTTVSPFFDLRGAVPPAVPIDLSTGCFSFNPFGCGKRVTHGTMNKDEGIIDPISGATSGPTTSRGKVGTNFARAVADAELEAQRQWSDFSAELIATYGATNGNLMVCALTHDDPLKTCTGRRIMIVVDSSGSNQETDPSNLRIAAAAAFNASLTSAAEAGPGETPDLSGVVDFDESARLVSPLADPSLASFAGIDSNGGTDIGSGVSVAIQELTKDPAVDPRDRSGIVVLTDGEDGGSSLPGALATAASLGIRVSFGFLSPPDNPVPPPPPLRAPVGVADQPPPDYVPAILATGGVYSVIDSAASQAAFVQLVGNAGAVNQDDPNGAAPGGPLEKGISSSAQASAGARAVWTYATHPGALLHLAITPQPGIELDAQLVDVRTQAVLATVHGNSAAPAVIDARTASGQVALTVSVATGVGPYAVRVDEPEKLLLGTPGPDALTCGPTATLVVAAPGDDTVNCGAGADTIIGGAGLDQVNAGDGDDVIVLVDGDGAPGDERIDGGNGADIVFFLVPRPKGQACQGDTAAQVTLAPGSRVLMTNVEAVFFQYQPCSLVLPTVTFGKLRPIDPAIALKAPPKPKLTVARRQKVARNGGVKLTVRVGGAASVVAVGTLRVGKRTLHLTDVTYEARGASKNTITLKLPAGAKRYLAHRKSATAVIDVLTIRVANGPKGTSRSKVTLKLG